MDDRKARPWHRHERSSRLIDLALTPCTVRVEELNNALPSTVSSTKIEDLEIASVENNEIEFRGRFSGGQFPSKVAVLAEVIESNPGENKQNVYILPLGADTLSSEGEFVFTTRSVGGALQQLVNGQKSNFRVRIGIFGIDIWNQYQYVGDRLIKLNAKLVDISTSRNYIVSMERLKYGEVKPSPPPPKLGSTIYFL